NLGGNILLDRLGPLERHGGQLIVSGTVDNTGRTIAPGSLPGDWQLSGTIVGGRVEASPVNGMRLRDDDGYSGGQATLRNLTLAGELIGAKDTLNLDNVTLDNATIRLGNQHNMEVYISQTGGLSGQGEIVFTQGASKLDYGTSSNPGKSGTIFEGLTVRNLGGTTTFGNGIKLNLGSILADAPGGQVNVGSWNSTSPWINRGVVRAAHGGTVYLFDYWSNEAGGRIELDDGVLVLGGDLTLERLHDVQRHGGRLVAGGKIAFDGPTWEIDPLYPIEFGRDAALTNTHITSPSGVPLVISPGATLPGRTGLPANLEGSTIDPDIVLLPSALLWWNVPQSLEGKTIDFHGAGASSTTPTEWRVPNAQTTFSGAGTLRFHGYGNRLSRSPSVRGYGSTTNGPWTIEQDMTFWLGHDSGFTLDSSGGSQPIFNGLLDARQHAGLVLLSQVNIGPLGRALIADGSTLHLKDGTWNEGLISVTDGVLKIENSASNFGQVILTHSELALQSAGSSYGFDLKAPGSLTFSGGCKITGTGAIRPVGGMSILDGDVEVTASLGLFTGSISGQGLNSKLINHGSLQVQRGYHPILDHLTLDQSGKVQITQNSSLTLTDGVLESQGLIWIESQGRLILDHSTARLTAQSMLVGSGFVDLPDSTLAIAGLLNPTQKSYIGGIFPENSAFDESMHRYDSTLGQLTFDGDVTLESEARIRIDIDDPGTLGERVNVTGLAKLGGTLELLWLTDQMPTVFEPGVVRQWVLMTYGQRDGRFDHVILPELRGARFTNLVYGEPELTITVVIPEPASLSVLLLATSAAMALNRNRH
ncbi:MAG: hypothetical protein IT305_24345, partial [Chloroflexi bacterium]|nr:hypothetical protein [Chloroflexota bacterium]